VLSESEYWGGIREDSMKRVYFTTSGMTGETLLYDFSLGIGDTIKAFGPVGIVSFIDSISIGGQYRRRLNFRTPHGTAWPFGAWIEGLGNSALGGLLNSPMAQPTCDCAANLICFRQNGVWLYHNPHQTTDCFGATLRINEVTPVSALTIIPNPVNGTAHIHITGSQTFTRLIVYGLNGNLVLNADVTNKREFVLNSSGLPAGLYCYRLYHENGLGLTGKFSIQ
jgi:hypothetical protein